MSWSPELYQRAARFAAEAHNTQKYPGGELPYLLHVVQVAAEVMGTLARESVEQPDLAVACALLHDVLEDTDTPAEALRAAFGSDVVAGVAALSKNPSLPKREAMVDSLERIKKQPREVWMVKLADRITNLQPPPHYWTAEKIDAYREEAVLIADTLGSANAYLSARLRERVANYPSR
jgi:(p)ppGpp synthase/HD superfamily hydrolase